MQSVILFLLAATPIAFAQAPSAQQLALVTEAYDASGFDTPIDNSLAFNIQLEAQALLSVAYAGTVVSNGAPLATSNVATQPAISVTPGASNASHFGTGELFTLMLADASAIGGPDPQGDYRHYLANGVSFAVSAGTNATQALNATGATVITPYAAPGPLAGSGVHRYAWLLFAQPASFTAPANLSTAGTAASHWDVSSYVTSSGLGSLVAASWFTVAATGTPTFSAGTTSSVPTSVASSSSSTSSSAAAAASGTAAAPASSSKASSAETLVGGLSAIIAGLMLAI